MTFRKLLWMLFAALFVVTAPVSAVTSVTFGKISSTTGGFVDIKTGSTPATERMIAQKAWDNPVTHAVNETIDEMWCIEPDVAALYKQPLTFTVMSLANYVATGAMNSTDANLFAGWVKAGTFGNLSNADTQGLLYQATGGAINYGHAHTASFFASANSAASLIPTHFFNMKGVGVLISPKDANDQPLTQDYLYVGSVPEPASWAMMVAGFGLVGAGMRRRSPMRVAA